MTTLLENENNEAPSQQEQQSYRPLVIVLAGPTAVGKSDVAAELCSPAISLDISQGHDLSFIHAQQKINNIIDDDIGRKRTAATRGHVVSADSVQAYRGVDIGANKPTSQEMERTPHHLVNVVDPPTDPSKAASYNAADWMRDARYVIRELTSFDGDVGDDDDEERAEGDGNDDALMRRETIEKALSQSLGVSDSDEKTIHTTKPTILPVVVGGTMMYLQWLVHGRPDAIRPTEEAVERAADKINEFRREAEDTTAIMASKSSSDSLGKSTEKDETIITDEDDESDVAAWKAASTYVSSLGPVFTQRVDKLPGRDWYRLRRLLEVAYTIASKNKPTSQPSSAGANNNSEHEILQNLTEKQVYTGIRSGSLPDLGYDVRCFFLCPDERMTHFHTVDHRCEQMLMRGLLRETASLHASGGLPEESQVTRAIGYRQALEYLKRKDAKRNDHGALMGFMDVFSAATRQYGKKQMQWFRRDAEFAFIPVQMECEKGKRVGGAAKMIADMCKLSAVDFEAELSSSATNNVDGSEESGGGGLPLSARTKLDNERQGKKMKFFLSKRVSLIDGSDDFLTVLAEADECTKQVQGLGEEF